MNRFALAFVLLVAMAFPTAAQTYYDIDVDLPEFPDMEFVPGSPVYYAPNVDSNYFFYDGLFWDFSNEGWYSSAWYNGPWEAVDPVYVPTYVLWVPIRYYRRPPGSFHGWAASRPPRWGERWGRDWQQRHNAVYGGVPARPPARAPLPQYQRQFTRANYPLTAQQNALQRQHYPYQPRENVVLERYRRGATTAQPPLQKYDPLPPGFVEDRPRR